MTWLSKADLGDPVFIVIDAAAAWKAADWTTTARKPRMAIKCNLVRIAFSFLIKEKGLLYYGKITFSDYAHRLNFRWSVNNLRNSMGLRADKL
jgi:hypothetical protein